MTYRLTYGLKFTGSHETFKQAFLALHRLVLENFSDDRQVPPSFLASIWLEHGTEIIQFHQVCDEAFRQGLIDETGALKPCAKTSP
jgi:hypothetical protein